MNETAVALCRDLSLSSHETWVALIWAWWSVSLTLSLGLLIFTATKARIKYKEMNRRSSAWSYPSLPSDISEGSEEDPPSLSPRNSLSSMYQTIPEEYTERKRGSDLEIIAEDDEGFVFEDESDVTDSSPPSRGSGSSSPAPPLPSGQGELEGGRNRFSGPSLQHLQLPAIKKDAFLRQG